MMSSVLALALDLWRSKLVAFVVHNIKWLVVAVAVALAFHKGRLAERTANELATARATVAILEAVAKRNEEAALGSQYRAVIRAEERRALEAKVEAYAAEIMARRAQEQDLVQQHNETVDDYEKRLQRLGRTSARQKAGVSCGCTLDRSDVERLRDIR